MSAYASNDYEKKTLHANEEACKLRLLMSAWRRSLNEVRQEPCMFHRLSVVVCELTYCRSCAGFTLHTLYCTLKIHLLKRLHK